MRQQRFSHTIAENHLKNFHEAANVAIGTSKAVAAVHPATIPDFPLATMTTSRFDFDTIQTHLFTLHFHATFESNDFARFPGAGF